MFCYCMLSSDFKLLTTERKQKGIANVINSEIVFKYYDDSGGRRSGIDRRYYSYSSTIPERRESSDRRSGVDRRNEMDRRNGLERRTSFP